MSSKSILMSDHHKVAAPVMWVALAMAMITTTTSRVEGLSGEDISRLVAENRTGCLLVFGDSSVDPGNNNRLNTSIKCNFLPYGRDYISAKPTGRFTNGRLATDFLGEVLGCGKSTVGFLDPNLSQNDLKMKGVSFASSGSGYDDLTANLSSVLTLSRQVNYFMHYKIHLARAVGHEEANKHIEKAIFLLSLGSNDFLQNYFIEPIRTRQYDLQSYEDFLISSLHNFTQDIHRLGAKRLVLVGLPNIGCMPIARLLVGTNSNNNNNDNGSSSSSSGSCVESLNQAASSFNSKLLTELTSLQHSLGLKIFYADVYGSIDKAIKNPKDYGFTETSKGCCGTGTFEFGETCRGLSICSDPSKHVFWDAIHPSEHMCKIISDMALDSISYDFFT